MLIDESGFFLNPLVRRTWAKRGRTPTLRTWGRHRDKVSVVAAWSVAPHRCRLGLHFRTDARRYFGAEMIAAFLREEVLSRLRGEVIVLWDGGSSHRGGPVRDLLAAYPRLHVEPMPAYTPQLNPVEFVWSYLKYDRLANFVPENVWHLERVVRTELCQVGQTRGLLKSLWLGSELPFPHRDIT